MSFTSFHALAVFLVYFIETCNGNICCAPNQLELIQTQAIAMYKDDKFVGVKTVIDIAYDQTHLQMAINETVIPMDGPESHVSLIYDYKKEVLYTIIGMTCTSQKLTSPFAAICIPDNATIVGPVYLGIDPHTFPGTQYSYSASGIDVSFVFTPDCIPISETITGQIGGGPMVLTNEYYNSTKGISDPNVFIPPSFCNHTASKNVGHQTTHHNHNHLSWGLTALG